MPIAHCIISSDCPKSKLDVCEVWRVESGIATEEMTINMIVSNHQFGKRYKIMTTLYLPSAWSKKNISSLQLGLAKALAKCFGLPVEQIHIITSIVHPGLVVEDGQEQEW